MRVWKLSNSVGFRGEIPSKHCWKVTVAAGEALAQLGSRGITMDHDGSPRNTGRRGIVRQLVPCYVFLLNVGVQCFLVTFLVPVGVLGMFLANFHLLFLY